MYYVILHCIAYTANKLHHNLWSWYCSTFRLRHVSNEVEQLVECRTKSQETADVVSRSHRNINHRYYITRSLVGASHGRVCAMKWSDRVETRATRRTSVRPQRLSPIDDRSDQLPQLARSMKLFPRGLHGRVPDMELARNGALIRRPAPLPQDVGGGGEHHEGQ